MAFDSDRARIEPEYYDEYEAGVASRMARFESLGAKVASDDFNQRPEDFEAMGARIEALVDGAKAHIGFRPFTHHLVRVQAIQTSDGLPEPFNAVGVNAFRELRPIRHAKLVGARVWALLGSQPNSPSMKFGIGFNDESAVMSGFLTTNVNIPYTLDRQYEKVAALNVLTLLEASN